MRPVLTLGRRAIDFAVLILAVYALAVVPLGHRTGLEHLRAILRTKAARDAGRDIRTAAERFGRHLLGDDQRLAPRGRPEVPTLPRRVPSNFGATMGPFEGPDASVGGR